MLVDRWCWRSWRCRLSVGEFFERVRQRADSAAASFAPYEIELFLRFGPPHGVRIDLALIRPIPLLQPSSAIVTCAKFGDRLPDSHGQQPGRSLPRLCSVIRLAELCPQNLGLIASAQLPPAELLCHGADRLRERV